MKTFNIDELIERKELFIHGDRSIVRDLDKLSAHTFSQIVHGAYTAHQDFQKITGILDLTPKPDDNLYEIWNGPKLSILCGDGTEASIGSKALAGTIFLATDIGGYSSPLSKDFVGELGDKVETEIWLRECRKGNYGLFTRQDIDPKQLKEIVNQRVKDAREAYRDFRGRVRESFAPYVKISGRKLSEAERKPDEFGTRYPWLLSYAVKPNESNGLPEICLTFGGDLREY